MTQWMKRHKFLTFFGVLLMLSSCGAVLGDDTAQDASPAAKRPPVEAAEDSTTPSPSPSASPTEEVAVPEPTPQEVWADNYDASGASYVAVVATALALRPKSLDAQSGSLDACRLLSKERKLDKRIGRVQTSFGLVSKPTNDQALAVLEATAATICPEFAALHQAQTAERAKRLRIEERRRKEREKARQQQQQLLAEQQAQQEAQQLAEQQAEQQNVYFANCTEVENAGAAPIYAGDPGYSGDLDRDGDGVACEQ